MGYPMQKKEQTKLGDVKIDPAKVGLIYDKARDKLGLCIDGTNLFADGAYDISPDPDNIIRFGDCITMIKRIMKSAADSQSSRFHLIKWTEYAEENGLDTLPVHRFCCLQKSYAYGVRRVKVGDGNEYFIPSNLDARVIIVGSAELLEVNAAIRRYLESHPASTVSKISTNIKRSSSKVRNELARMIKDGHVLFDRPSGRYTLRTL
jgi:hypothetical protein